MRQQGDACVYTGNHTVVVYRTTTDLASPWEYLGIALAIKDRYAGTVFRPHVVYNQKSGQFVMWYMNREHASAGADSGYAIAVAASAVRAQWM